MVRTGVLFVLVVSLTLVSSSVLKKSHVSDIDLDIERETRGYHSKGKTSDIARDTDIREIDLDKRKASGSRSTGKTSDITREIDLHERKSTGYHSNGKTSDITRDVDITRDADITRDIDLHEKKASGSHSKGETSDITRDAQYVDITRDTDITRDVDITNIDTDITRDIDLDERKASGSHSKGKTSDITRDTDITREIDLDEREASSNKGLHALMEAVRRYLHETDSKSTDTESAAVDDKDAKPPSAHEDIRTVYSAGVNEQDVNTALADGVGFWTNWIDIDRDPSKSTGEFEDCTNIKWRQNDEARCYLGCETPAAARYQVVDESTKATWGDIENCIGPIDATRANSCGFTCENADAKAYPKTTCELAKCVAFGLGEGCVRCPDVRVQFFCKGRTTDDGVAPDKNRCCPYSMSCSTFKDLKSALLQLDMKHRKDVVAGILADVGDVLKDGKK